MRNNISSSASSSPSRPHHSFSASLMEESVEIAETIITKWDVNSSVYCIIAPLFDDDRTEGKQFIKSVKDLQKAMDFFSTENYSHDMLVKAQRLMQIAMKRLEKEFHGILSASRNYLESESVSSKSSTRRSSLSDFFDDVSEDETKASDNSISEVERISETVMSDLKMIADAMISSGYSKECVKIYNIVRKSIVDETLYHLGSEKLSFSQIQKMEWEVMEFKIKNWLNAVKVAVKTLFNVERILCDFVFSASEKIGDSCFAEISKAAAMALFEFPELVAKSKKSPEKMFRTLDLYDSISDLVPEIESIFSSESTSAVRSQAVTSLEKLSDAVRATLSEFESAIQKHSSRLPVPGGGVHPLSRYVMNYLVFLGDYSGTLSDIISANSESPVSVHSPLPESYLWSPASDDAPTSELYVKLAWIILVLLAKLDGKAVLYNDVPLSYLYLTNNLNYVVQKVNTSNLKLLLGDEWLANHERKVKQYAANYERIGWNKVISSLPDGNPTAEISPERAEECFKRFNSAFEEAYRRQTSWVVPDPKLRDEIKISLSKKIVPAYRELYDRHRLVFRREFGAESIVRFAPDDLDNYLSDLFHGASVSGSTSATWSHASV